MELIRIGHEFESGQAAKQIEFAFLLVFTHFQIAPDTGLILR